MYVVNSSIGFMFVTLNIIDTETTKITELNN